MSRNGVGVYSLPATYNPVVTATPITIAWANTTLSDIATALTNSIACDGQTTITANLPMWTFKHTGVGNASARDQYAAAGQVQDGSLKYAGTVGGTADVITLTLAPAVTAYAAGQVFEFIASGANTTNVTVNVNGLGAKAVTKNGAVALIAGDIPSGAMCTIKYDGTQFQLVSTAASVNKVAITQPASSATLTIADGATLSVPSTAAVSGTNTGDQNLFSTIAVSGQSDVVADSTADTLTLVAGSNVTITTDASTDTITIAASGSGDASTNTSTSVDSEIALFSGTGGKTLKRATTTGLLKVTSGVIGAVVSGTDIKTVNGTSLLGSGDISAGNNITRVTRTSNTILDSANSQNLIDVTSGTFTQTITAAATLGSGWFCYYRNSGTGIVTIDPNGSETINGLTTIKVYPTESFMIVCDGSNFYTFGRTNGPFTVSSVSASGAAVDFETELADPEVKRIRIIGKNLTSSSTAYIGLRVKKSGSYASTNYIGGLFGSTNFTSTTEVRLGDTLVSSEPGGADFTVDIDVANGTSEHTQFSGTAYANSTPRGGAIDAKQTDLSAVQGIRVLPSAGSFASGTLRTQIFRG